jgi:hypothetical protein
VAVSHDQRFLAEIKVDRWPQLSAGRLPETRTPDGGRTPGVQVTVAETWLSPAMDGYTKA